MNIPNKINAINKKWKVSNYRSNHIICRDPSESTYNVGDDKFKIIAYVDDFRIAEKIVAEHNKWIDLQEHLSDEEKYGININADNWID